MSEPSGSRVSGIAETILCLMLAPFLGVTVCYEFLHSTEKTVGLVILIASFLLGLVAAGKPFFVSKLDGVAGAGFYLLVATLVLACIGLLWAVAAAIGSIVLGATFLAGLSVRPYLQTIRRRN